MSLIKPSKGPHKLYPCGIPFPVGLWLMNENSGSLVNDLSGNGNTGTFRGGLVWGQGKYGLCPNFDGVDDDIQIAHKSSIDFSTGSFTILFGLEVDAITTEDYAIVKGSFAASWYAVNFYSNQLFFAIDDGVTKTNLNSVSLVNDAWHHWACVRDVAADKLRIYQDAVQTNSMTDASGDISSTGDLWFGSAAGKSEANCRFDYIMIFNKALPARQIAYLYRNPFPWFIEDEVSHLYVPVAGGVIVPWHLFFNKVA